MLRLAAMLVALAAGVMTPEASAQVLYGSLVGQVKDPQGASIPGAVVAIVNRDNGLTREATTDEQGNYSLINVLAGPYDIKVTLTGFKEMERQNVPVSVGQVARVDVTLEVGALTETVTVESSSTLLQTDKADVSTELKSREIEALPTNQFRNYQALLNLVPGTAPARFQNAETDTPARSLAVNVNGQAINNNATRTDGATNVNIWLPSHNMYVSPAETVDTVNISTNNFDAEQGMAGGAAITVVTKSGTNQFRGSGFEFFNSDKLNATPYFFGNDPKGKPDKLPIRRDIFGATLGGPIKRNHVFFFGSFEGYKSSQSLFTFHSVPNAVLRNGDFSGAVNTNGSQQVIFDPATGNADGTGRTPFPGNVIPANRISPIAMKILQLFPLENTPGVGAGALTNNYQREETRTTDRYNYDGKVNWNRTSSHQIWGKYSFMDATVDDLTNYLGPDPNAQGDGGLTKVWQFTAGQTWTLAPTLILDSTFGFSRQDQQVLGPDFQAGNYGLDVLGIPGTNDQGIGDDRYAGYPRFGTGFSALGNRDGWNPIFRDERTYSVATNMTKVAGRHEFRGGYLANYLYLDHWQPESGNPRGNFDFATNATALRNGAQAGNFYNTYAAFLLGLVGTSGRSNQAELMTAREWQHSLFVRDRWTVSPKLTLDLGLRWEYYPIMKRADRGLERLDLNTLEVILGGKGGNPDSVGLSAAKDNFAPRVGAVYRFDDNTVLRSGFGVTYNPIPWGRVMRGDNIYPVTIASTFPAVDPFGYVSTLNQGIPQVVLPSLESGRVALPNSATIVTPEIGNVDRGTIKSWNLAFERRLPLNIGLDMAYVAAYGDGGYAFLDINAPQVIGSGNQGRPYFNQFGRINAVNSFGERLKTRYNSLQMSLNRPMSRGVMLKGA
ncbi:MAG TPA: TonB-dependent receptor, partial [Luteitalea sp.]|nr:TonB-dependent receptor [Luteitalea sp.]